MNPARSGKPGGGGAIAAVWTAVEVLGIGLDVSTGAPVGALPAGGFTKTRITTTTAAVTTVNTARTIITRPQITLRTPTTGPSPNDDRHATRYGDPGALAAAPGQAIIPTKSFENIETRHFRDVRGQPGVATNSHSDHRPEHYQVCNGNR